jgi:hypothetical protein
MQSLAESVSGFPQGQFQLLLTKGNLPDLWHSPTSLEPQTIAPTCTSFSFLYYSLNCVAYL